MNTIVEGEVQYTPAIKFQFTRHGYSCNNAADIFSKEFEPSLHPFAIEQLNKTITYDSNGKLRFNKSDSDDTEKFEFETFNQPESQSKGIHVFVSPLIRTWETALLLFSQANPSATTLNLYVAPYLKEKKQLNIRNGNFPLDPKIIMDKFLKFINILEVKSLITNIETICIHWPQNINVSNIDDIEMKKIEFKRERETIKGIASLIGGNDGNDDKPNFKISDGNNICNITNIDNEKKTDDTSIFLQEGNLEVFMDKFEELKSNYNKNLVINKNEEQVVHIVTHSNIMKKHLKKKYNVDIKGKSAYIKYDKGNNWSFTDTREQMEEAGSLNLKIGVPETHDRTSITMMKKNTCGVKGENLCPQGGKRTKKKRKNKRTHKKKNAHKKRKTQNKRKNRK